MKSFWSAVRYYIHKVVAHGLSELVALRRTVYREPGMRAVAPSDFSFSGTFVLAFWDPILVHLGDQLFHEPLARALKRVGAVKIVVDPRLEPYFKGLGYDTIRLAELGQGGHVFISKNDMLHAITSRFPQAAAIGIDYAAIEGGDRVVVAMIGLVSRALQGLGLQPLPALSGPDFEPAVPASLTRGCESAPWAASIAHDGRYLAFNNYVASGIVEAKQREHLLVELVQKMKDEGYRIIHTGSAGDKRNDPRAYPFVDIDLRGRFSPTDLFSLFAHPAVRGVVSFDAYVVHVASLLKKDLYVVAKSAATKDAFGRRFVPMFPGGERLLKEYL
ncbi:MAG TPA: hypothetical protein VMT99_02175 [Candidatus Paceibacterota bacterium]|nr:hypothetical protein [Candidatus Paceibacterota bacterium]